MPSLTKVSLEEVLWIYNDTSYIVVLFYSSIQRSRNWALNLKCCVKSELGST